VTKTLHKANPNPLNWYEPRLEPRNGLDKVCLFKIKICQISALSILQICIVCLHLQYYIHQQNCSHIHTRLSLQPVYNGKRTV
jgi:hypothetical protein